MSDDINVSETRRRALELETKDLAMNIEILKKEHTKLEDIKKDLEVSQNL